MTTRFGRTRFSGKRSWGAIHLLLLVAAVGFALIGCAATGADTDSLKTGFAKYSDHQPDEASAIADRFIAAHPNAATVDEAYYLRGLAHMARNNRNAAIDDLRMAITKSSRADLKGKAYRALADLAAEQSQWTDVQKFCEAALATGALSPANATHVNYGIGAALQAQGQWDKAQAYFARVLAAKNDPDREARALARINLTAFTIQFGAFKEAANARTKVSQLQTAGITATIASDNRGDGLWYLVQSGTYHTWAQAAAAREQLQAKSPDLVAIVP